MKKLETYIFIVVLIVSVIATITGCGNGSSSTSNKVIGTGVLAQVDNASDHHYKLTFEDGRVLFLKSTDGFGQPAYIEGFFIGKSYEILRAKNSNLVYVKLVQ